MRGGLGHVEHADRRTMPTRFATRCRACSIWRPASQIAGAGRRRQPELVHAHPGHRRRPAAHPRVADASRRVLQRAGRRRAPPRSPCSARRSATQLFGAGRRSGRPDHPHPQPAVQGHRRDGGQGPAGMGADMDDQILVPYTTVQKKLLGVTYIQHITVSAASAGETSAVADADRRAAAHAPQDRARARTTTSWSARSRKSPTSARRRWAR